MSRMNFVVVGLVLVGMLFTCVSSSLGVQNQPEISIEPAFATSLEEAVSEKLPPLMMAAGQMLKDDSIRQVAYLNQPLTLDENPPVDCKCLDSQKNPKTCDKSCEALKNSSAKPSCCEQSSSGCCNDKLANAATDSTIDWIPATTQSECLDLICRASGCKSCATTDVSQCGSKTNCSGTGTCDGVGCCDQDLMAAIQFSKAQFVDNPGLTQLGSAGRNLQPIQQYCERMSTLLAISLKCDDRNPMDLDSRQHAIEAAMLMVAETVEKQAELEKLQIRAQHAEALLKLERRMTDCKNDDAGEAITRIGEWISPLYANQHRNFREMKQVAINSKATARKVELLEKRLMEMSGKNRNVRVENPMVDRNTIQLTSPQDTSYQSFRQPESETAAKLQPIQSEANRKENRSPEELLYAMQVHDLKQRIQQLDERLKAIQDERVKPAGHLEPIYSPQKRLKPLLNR